MCELPEGLTPDVVEQFLCPNASARPGSTEPELGPRDHTLAIVAEFTAAASTWSSPAWKSSVTM